MNPATKIQKTDAQTVLSSPTSSSPADEEPTPFEQATPQTQLSRKERNQLSARRSRQRRAAYLLKLEFELKVAHLRIQSLEAELRAARAGSIFEESCTAMAAEEEGGIALIDPIDMGIYESG